MRQGDRRRGQKKNRRRKNVKNRRPRKRRNTTLEGRTKELRGKAKEIRKEGDEQAEIKKKERGKGIGRKEWYTKKQGEKRYYHAEGLGWEGRNKK